MTLLLLKSLHFIGWVFWYAALFFISRILYEQKILLQNNLSNDKLYAEYTKMSTVVYKKVMTPAMMLTWIAGSSMLFLHGFEWFKLNLWMHFKLLFLILLSGHHGITKKVLKRFSENTLPFKAKLFDFYLHFPFMLLLVIIVLAVFKNIIYPAYSALIMFGLATGIYTLKTLLIKDKV